MQKVIIKCEGILKPDDLHRIEQQISKDISNNGFVVLPGNYEVITFDDGKEQNG